MYELSMLIKPASGLCNMRCKYCFYTGAAQNMMTLEVLEVLVQKAFAENARHCSFGFQGGEPTLAGLDFFRALVAFVKKYNINNTQVSYSLQTNGLLIDEEWAAFFGGNKFLVGISIDAEKQVHDSMRADSAGKSTHNRCMKAARLLKKTGVEFNILSVVTSGLAAHPERAYNFYKREGFGHVQLIPCIDVLNAEIYGKFLIRFFDLWYEDLMRGKYISIRDFDNYVYMLAGHPPESCALAGSCKAYPLIEADGSVYPCDFYVRDEYLLGSILSNSFSGMLNSETARVFEAPSKQAHSECACCEYYFICRGGCRRNREPLAVGELRLNRFCSAYKKFFAHALPLLRNVAAKTFF